MAEIKNALFDLDSTLVKTQERFDADHEEAIGLLAGELGRDFGDVRAQLRKMWKSGYLRYSVDSDRLIAHVIENLCLLYPEAGSRLLIQVGSILNQVYYKPIDLYDDVEKTIGGLAALQIGLGIVTHRRGSWTNRTLNEHPQVRDALVNKRAFSCKPSQVKDRYAWLAGAYWYKFDPAETVVIGDSKDGDANAAANAGFYMSFWLTRPELSWWGGGVDEHGLHNDVLRVTSLTQVLELIRPL